jgi:hypothetical protein
LEPNTLFTFARSALVSASVALTAYGVPLQISVIPESTASTHVDSRTADQIYYRLSFYRT